MTDSTSRPRSKLLAFADARLIARSLKPKTRDEWRAWVRENRAVLEQLRVPTRPDIAYERLGWVDWSDWLHATPRTITKPRFTPQARMSFQKWLAWTQARRFRTKEEYNDWSAANVTERKRLGVPSSPAHAYAEFAGWNTVLDATKQSKFKGRKRGQYASWNEAKKFARAAPLKRRTASGWRAWARENKASLASARVPADPRSVYPKFYGWEDFLGTNRRATISRKR